MIDLSGHILALTERLLNLPGNDLLFAPASHYEALLAAMCQRILALEAMPSPQAEADPAREPMENARFSPDLFRQHTSVSQPVAHINHASHDPMLWEPSQNNSEPLSPGKSATPSATPLNIFPQAGQPIASPLDILRHSSPLQALIPPATPKSHSNGQVHSNRSETERPESLLPDDYSGGKTSSSPGRIHSWAVSQKQSLTPFTAENPISESRLTPGRGLGAWAQSIQPAESISTKQEPIAAPSVDPLSADPLMAGQAAPSRQHPSADLSAPDNSISSPQTLTTRYTIPAMPTISNRLVSEMGQMNAILQANLAHQPPLIPDTAVIELTPAEPMEAEPAINDINLDAFADKLADYLEFEYLRTYGTL